MVAFLTRPTRKRTLKRLNRLLASRQEGVRRFEDQLTSEERPEAPIRWVRMTLDQRLADVVRRVRKRDEQKVWFPPSVALGPRRLDP